MRTLVSLLVEFSCSSCISKFPRLDIHVVFRNRLCLKISAGHSLSGRMFVNLLRDLSSAKLDRCQLVLAIGAAIFEGVGASVALNETGDRMIVGAPGECGASAGGNERRGS